LSHCEAIGGCVCIPVFNHAATVGEVVRGSRQHAHTVLVCDDGSTDGSGEAAFAAGAEVLTHPSNQGKGAALRTLFEEASRRGFRYAICLDADGQHYPKDIAAIVETVKDEPGSVVIGARDLAAAQAPASSQFGRRFSNFWVWFEGGQRVDDSQSGFRAYPLPETLALMGSRSRYDFEVEVLLRASWAGLPLASTPIGVLYPEDRITHFRPFWDNARISVLNILTCLRLLLPLPLVPLLHERARAPGLSLDAIRRWFWLGGPGPIWRVLAASLALFWGGFGVLGAAALGAGALPALLAWRVLLGMGAQPQAGPAVLTGALVLGVAELLLRQRAFRRALIASPRAWNGKTRGGVAGHTFFIVVIKLFGRWPAYGVLYLVSAYFLVAAPAGRRASLQFLDRALGPQRGVKAIWRTYRHMLEFARTLVDRLILGVEGPSGFTRVETGVETILAASASRKGSILLTAHLGSWELASGMLGDRLTAPFDIVAFQGEDAAMRAAVRRSSEKFKPNVLSVGKGELAALDIMRALRAGHMVALQGDRTVDERTVEVDFLGSPARFPVGPFVLAAISGAPMIATFNMQIGPRTYELIAFDAQTYAFDRSRPKPEQLVTWVQDYVRKLETVVRKHPFQWFNFYDFWARP
jgi:predicted LPLAT superfamily acyltransferase